MTGTILERSNPVNAKTMASRPQRNQLLLVGLILISVCAKTVDAIGRWGEKQSSNDTEQISDGSSNINNSDMEKTYLDLFGESAKEFLTQKAPEKLKKVFPATDEECSWDWRYIRCEPYCECSFQPKLPGDFHLGRACRKRSHLLDASSEEPSEIPWEGASELYRDYCLSPENGEFVGSPPPPSIPSPFPVLAKSGKATWKILRTKTDPVLEIAAAELQVLHGKIQSVVCQDLKHRCNDDDDIDEGSPLFAWQERLFCGDVVKDCKSSMPLPISEGAD